MEHRHKLYVEGKIVYFIHTHASSNGSHRHGVSEQFAYPTTMPQAKRPQHKSD
jgi:hypothetical protein